MNAARALAWKEMRDLRANLVALAISVPLASVVCCLVGSLQEGVTAVHVLVGAAGALLSSAAVLGATLVAGDAAPSLQARLAISPLMTVLVRFLVRAAALACLVPVAILVVVVTGGMLGVPPPEARLSLPAVLAWLLAALLSAGLPSVFVRRPVAAAILSLAIFTLTGGAILVLVTATPLDRALSELDDLPDRQLVAALLSASLLAALTAASLALRLAWGAGFRRAMLRSAAIGVAGVALLVAGWIALGNAWAEHRLDQAARRWEELVGALDAAERFPDAETNDSARELERIVLPLKGISLGPKADATSLKPLDERREENAGRHEAESFPRSAAEADDPALVSPSPEAEAWLAARADALAAVRRHVASAPVPAWRVRLDMTAPIPNLLGHSSLQKTLLADAILSDRRGDSATALSDIEAAVRANEALKGQPALISQLVAIAAARLQVATIRQLTSAPPSLVERVDAASFTESSWRSYQAEVQMYLDLARADARTQASVFTASDSYPPLTRLAERVHFALVRPLVRLALARGIDDLAVVAAEERGRDACVASLPVGAPRARKVIGPGIAILPPGPAAFQWRLTRLRLESELARLVLEAKAARAADPAHAWPATLPSLDSHTCPGQRWNYEVGATGMKLSCWAAFDDDRVGARRHSLTHVESAR